MTIGRFDRGCWFLIICALAVLIEGKSGVLESWFLFHGKRYQEIQKIHAKREMENTAVISLSLAAQVTVSTNGLLDKLNEWPRPLFGQERIFINDTKCRHMAYSPSRNSYRLAAFPNNLTYEERNCEEKFLYVLQVFVQSNQISKIEIVSDKKEYFSYDVIADYLEDYGYAVNAVTNDGMCAYICSKP